VFLKYLSPVATIALLTTLVLLFAFKGNLIVRSPFHILLIAVPLFIQTNFIFSNLLRGEAKAGPGLRRCGPGGADWGQ